MDRRKFLIGGAGVLAGAAAGCGPRPEEPPPPRPVARPPGRKPATYALVPKTLNNPVFNLAKTGAERAARQTTAEQIEILYQGSTSGSAAEQADLIRQLIQGRVDGISISVVDPAAARAAIDEAADQKIPVICFDSDCPGSKRRTYYGVDNKRLGRQLVLQLEEAVGGGENMDGDVAILSGQASAQNLQDRVTAAKEQLAKYPRLRVLPTLFCDDSPDKAIEQIRATMEAHRDLRGWVFAGGWPLFRPNALDPVLDFKRTRIVAVEALPEQVDYLEKEQVACLLAQRCFAWGEESVKILNRLRTETTYNPPPFIDAGFDIVLRQPTEAQRKGGADLQAKVYSVEEYRRQWAEWSKPS
jgi:ribose transport system substrate-binding protein